MIMQWSIIWVFFILIQNHHPISFNKLLFHNPTNAGYLGCMVSAGPVQEKFRVINPFIKHWEAAKFDRTVLEQAHGVHLQRKKRSIANPHKSTNLHHQHQHTPNKIRLKFTAHDKVFRLLLREDPHSVFAPDVEIENTDGPLHYDVSRIYSGVLEDDEHSHVHGILTRENLFDGTITTKLEQYYVEPSNKYSPDLEANGIHTVVYKLSDVHFNGQPIEPNHKHEHCASERLHQKQVEMLAKRHVLTKREKRWLPEDLSDEEPSPFEVPFNDDMSKFRKPNNVQAEIITASNQNDHNSQQTINHNNRKNILTNNYNPNNSDFILRRYNKNILVNTYNNNSNANMSSRPSHKTHIEIITKNGATKKPNIIVNNYNPDFIYASNTNNNNNMNDNRQDMRDFMAATSAKSSMNDRKSTCMLYLQADHTFFQKMGSNEASIEAITRHVQRANTIYKVTDFDGNGKPDNITFMIKRIKVHNMSALNDSTYRFPGNYGVEKFLELFSEEDYDAFCLAYMFTYRDFEMGTLGLAWTGDLKNAGGVCEKNGHYRGSLKSLNTGIVTLLNYGKHVPPAVSHVTLAHEIGHNFGSPHDPDSCTPGGEDGNFIMFARATSGDKRNNNKFSPCSLKSIQMVLNTKARSTKGCFTEPQQSICGNGVVEVGEQCDCGWEEDCKDKCCFPMSRHPQATQKPCTLTPASSCSPSQGPCCTTACRLKSGDKCREDNGCRDPSHCDGLGAQCPPSINKPNKTICNKEFVCYMGECTGSICLAYGMESCQCIPGPGEPKTKACELCCKVPGEKNDCKSSFEWNKPPFDVPDMFAKPGTPCNNYNGYCDVFQKCRDVDPSGPLATLRRLLLSEESIASFKKWASSNWYILVITSSLILALLILSTKLLGKQSNLKLKTVTIIHSATTETVRLPDDNNGVIVHTAIRSKVPLKKKVRGERSAGGKSNKNKVGVKVEKNNNSSAAATSAANLDNNKNAKKENKKLSALLFDNKKHNLTKKKRMGSPSQPTAVADEQQPNKPKSKTRNILSKKEKKNKFKEVIDYSKPAITSNNTFGKVHKWLLESPAAATSQPQQVEHASVVTKIMNKSQSTPEQLATAAANPQMAVRRGTVVTSPQKVKTKSVGSLNEKVRLQVVYNGGFKFSLKLSKNPKTASVKTHVLPTGIGKIKRKPMARVLDRKRATVAASSDQPAAISGRAAMLIQTTNPETNEPQYETILKTNKSAPIYENIKFKEAPSAKNRSQDPFRANRSASSSNLTGSQHQIANKSKVGSISNLNEMSNTSNNNLNNRNSNLKSKRSSSISFNSRNNGGHNNNMNTSNYYNAPLLSSSASNTNLEKIFSNSQQNLLRSSTTNLDKQRKNSLDMFGGGQQHHHHHHQHPPHNYPSANRGSNSNLSQQPHPYQRQSSSRNNSRKNSFNTKKQQIIRSNSNNVSANSTHPPATSTKFATRQQSCAPTDFQRQTSLNLKAPTPLTGQRFKSNDSRPHTAACDQHDGMQNPFEWPTVLTRDHKKFDQCDPLASDMEVMVSDMENVLNDDR